MLFVDIFGKYLMGISAFTFVQNEIGDPVLVHVWFHYYRNTAHKCRIQYQKHINTKQPFVGVVGERSK